MATMGFQNGRWGLERGSFLGFWALKETFAQDIFLFEHSKTMQLKKLRGFFAATVQKMAEKRGYFRSFWIQNGLWLMYGHWIMYQTVWCNHFSKKNMKSKFDRFRDWMFGKLPLLNFKMLKWKVFVLNIWEKESTKGQDDCNLGG